MEALKDGPAESTLADEHFEAPSNMKKRYYRILLGLALLLPACGGSGDVSFSGKWTIVKENAISDQKSEESVDVIAEGNKFRLHSVDEETDTLLIYDGSNLTEKTTVLKTPEGETPAAPRLTTTRKTDMEVSPLRFWAVSFSGNTLPGGQIAGRDTVLYQAQEVRPDGQMTVQAWVDPQTNVVLKRVFTIYSSQIEQLVSRSTEECREIHYGPLDDANFTRP